MFYYECMTRPRYIEIQCKSALNRVRDMPFKWSLNPYRGCAHACHYCYARASHTYYDLNADEDFETTIFVKVNVADVLRRELARPSWTGEPVALGTATDCYQPAEGRFRLTRGVLETLLDHETPLSIVTKSTMILRDRDLLAALARRVKVRVFFTVTTLDRALWKMIEPGTPPPLQRLRVLEELRAAGVTAGVLIAPILPGITDSAESIDAVMAAAEAHGASFCGASSLRLAPLVKEHYFGVVAERFPDLLPRYQRAYTGAYAPRAYRDRLDERIEQLRARHHFGGDVAPTSEPAPPAKSMRLQRAGPVRQLGLPFAQEEPS